MHAAGGRIFLQLWHVGRISDPDLPGRRAAGRAQRGRAKGDVSLLRPQRAYLTPRALETEEIPGVVEAYRKGAENAKAAGFDGVELHGANGYLLDQFLQDSSNRRTTLMAADREPRPPMLEVDRRRHLRLGPGPGRPASGAARRRHDMGDSDLAATFGYVAASWASATLRSSAPANRQGATARPRTQGGVRRRLCRQREVYA